MLRRANPLDRKLIRFQSPRLPWVMQFHLTLTGPLDRETLTGALLELSDRRPEVAGRLDLEDLTWHVGDPLRIVDASSLDEAFDLERGSVRVLRHSATSIEFHINHAFGDGVGCIAVFDDLLRIVRGECLPERSPLTEHDFDVLRAVSLRSRVSVWSKLFRMALQRTARWPGGTRSHTTVRSVSTEVLGANRGDHSTSNDTYVAAVHRSIATVLDTNRPTRISVPVDVRPFIGERTGLGNGVLNATTILPRANRPLHLDADEVARQLRPQRDRQYLGALLSVYLRVVPDGPPRSSDARRRLQWPDTGVCSNVGVVDVEGLDELWASPPAQNIIGTALAINGSQATIAVRARGPASLIEAVADQLVVELNSSSGR